MRLRYSVTYLNGRKCNYRTLNAAILKAASYLMEQRTEKWLERKNSVLHLSVKTGSIELVRIIATAQEICIHYGSAVNCKLKQGESK